MAFKIGSARIDENGSATGGKAGDQTGKEVSTQNYYVNSKGWVVLRCVNPEMRENIAKAMEDACRNNNIGYDQSQRLTLYKYIKDKDFDTSKCDKKVETDCSALVRVCVMYAARKYDKEFSLPNFTTVNEADKLMATGLFEKLTAKKYTERSTYLKRGDILVTKTKGHTVVCLSNGTKVEPDVFYTDNLEKGDKGDKVKILQTLLLRFAPKILPVYGADGDFGKETLNAVKEFQKHHMLEETGIVDDKMWKQLEMYASAKGEVHEEVSYGETGKIVTYLQTLLLKWNNKCLPVYGADGDFGKETLNAVKEFQKEKGLYSDGIVTSLTWIYLQI